MPSKIYPMSDVTGCEFGYFVCCPSSIYLTSTHTHRARVACMPIASNISGKAFIMPGGCVISDAALESGVLIEETKNIGTGLVVNGVSCKAVVPLHKDMMHDNIEIMACTNMMEAIGFLCKFCNVDISRMPLVYNIVVSARIANFSSMSQNRGATYTSVMQHFIDVQVSIAFPVLLSTPF